MPARSRRAPAPPARRQVRSGRAGLGRAGRAGLGAGGGAGAGRGPRAAESRPPRTRGQVGRDPETPARAPAVRCRAASAPRGPGLFFLRPGRAPQGRPEPEREAVGPGRGALGEPGACRRARRPLSSPSYLLCLQPREIPSEAGRRGRK